VNFAHLAAQLRAMRLRAGLKQIDLAKRSGVCSKTISHYE
jgi:transcriptional regulator with XRE-family HTH domain